MGGHNLGLLRMKAHGVATKKKKMEEICQDSKCNKLGSLSKIYNWGNGGLCCSQSGVLLYALNLLHVNIRAATLNQTIDPSNLMSNSGKQQVLSSI